MNAAARSAEQRRLGLALLASVAWHLAAAGVLPGPGAFVPFAPQPLQVRLPPPPEPPQRLARDESPAPLPREEAPAPLPQAAREEPPVLRQRARQVPAPKPAQPRLALAAAATPAAPPAFVVSPAPAGAGPAPLQSEPAPPAPPAGSEVAAVAPPRPVVDREALLARYMRSLAELIGRERVYPPQARLRGWEGAVTLRLRLDADGALRDAAVARSSGREVLDRQALAMVQGVDAWPQPPEALRSGEAFSVLMPVVFRLED